MEYTKVNNSDLEISIITFGAWAIGGWMWGGAEKKAAIRAIHKAMDLGVTSFDTAPVYGFGASEEIIARSIKGNRQNLKILTKYGLRWDTNQGKFYFDTRDNIGRERKIYKFAGKDSIIKECEESLTRLKTDYIDLYQIHWPDPTTPIAETMEAIEILLKQGKIRYAGVSNYNLDQLREAREHTHIISNQVPYSMVNRGIEEDLVPYCVENNISILAYSPLQRGLLTGKITNDYHFNDGDHRPNTPHFKEPNRERINNFLDEIKPIAENRNATLTQLVINWTIQQPGIASALVGARNPEQVEENILAANFMLDNEEIKTINEKLNNLKLEL
jgi:aryl-alcohol dehydrogenase-like predicted oxidoreductase